MNIFDFAMQMEKDGEEYYREIARKSRDRGMETIMNMLAEEEVKHYQILQEMKMRTPEVPETKILANVKNIFAEMRERHEEPSADQPQLEMYKKARELEKKSQDFYEEKSAVVETEAQKEILLKLADEEKRHFHIMENIITFVSRPHIWLENAEFKQLEDY